MSKPLIISSYEEGLHTADLSKTISRLDQEHAYKDLSTIIITPAFGSIPTRVVASWLNLMTAPNNKLCRLFAVGMEVGEAYSTCIESVLNHPDLSNWKYILTIEHDNLVPPDGLVKLLARAEDHSEYSAIGALYFTKGPTGVAQIWGDPHDHPINFRPQRPNKDELQECCGTGMGMTLFRISMFKDERLRRPWFKTTASVDQGSFSQDLYFWHDARKHGHRCAIDCSIRSGHWDDTSQIAW